MDFARASQHQMIESVYKGMKVVDVAGEKVGTVEYVGMGDPGDVTTEGNRPQEGILGGLVDAVTGGQPEPDVAGPMRDQLIRDGFIKIDGPGLFHTNRYVRSDHIASVKDDTVTLSVRKDELAKER
jgi:hypothetical protein